MSDTKVNISLSSGKVLELTPDEALEMYQELCKLYHTTNFNQYLPYQIWRPEYPVYPIYPTWYWTNQYQCSTTVVSDDRS